MTEDEIMRKRLTVEGDSGSDDRRIISLVKTFTRWLKSSSLSEEEMDATYQKMLFTLGQCEYSFSKTQLVMEMNKREMERYEQVYSQIESQIEESQRHISEFKQELQKARVIRRHRQEYDALAKVIHEQPPRQKSLENIDELEKKLKSLVSIRDSLNIKLELRKKQFHLLVHCVHQLQDTLQYGERQDADDDDDMEDIVMDTT